MLLNRLTRLKGYGRYACLGTAVLEVLGRRYKMHNLQKGRIDYLEQSLQIPANLCRPEQAVPFLARDYIAPTIAQQSVLCPTFRPQVVFMDSFSELTDQMFRHKTEHWSFCCNYRDLLHDGALSDTFESLGLLDLSDLHERYVRLSKRARQLWGNIPIVYLHFPDTLESRENFILRAAEIRRVAEACAQAIPGFYSFSVPSDIVQPPRVVEVGMEDFPYHYSEETYRAFADLIRQEPHLRKLFAV
jgi:hypothetical protein